MTLYWAILEENTLLIGTICLLALLQHCACIFWLVLVVELLISYNWCILLMQKELKRLVAYARSSANLLTKLILQNQTDSHGWEVHYTHLSTFGIAFLFFCYYMFLNLYLYWPICGLQCLFRTPLSLYDAVILLHGDRLPYPKRLLFTSELDQGIFLGGKTFAWIIFFFGINYLYRVIVISSNNSL